MGQIDDNEFIDYIDNSDDYSPEELNSLGHKMVDAGESRAVMYSIISNYEEDIEYANQLLGDDSDNNFRKGCSKKEEMLSISLKQLINQTKMETTMKMEDIVRAITSDLKSEIEQMFAVKGDFDKYAVDMLCNKYSIEKDYAEQVLKDIKKGIEDFSEQHAAFQKKEAKYFDEYISDLLKNKEDTEKESFLIHALIALNGISAINQGTELSEEWFNSEVNSYSGKPTCDLIKDLSAKLSNVSDFSLIIDEAGKNLELGNKENKKRIKELCEKVNLSSEKYMLITALSLYMAQRDGKLEVLAVNKDGDSTVINAELIGSTAAAAIEILRTTERLSNGEITLSKWQSIVKGICGVLFTIILYSCVAILSLAVILPVVLSLLSLLGGGVFAAFVSVALGIYLAFVLSDYGDKAAQWLCELIDEPFEKFLIKVTDAVKSIVAKIKAYWLKQKGTINVEEDGLSKEDETNSSEKNKNEEGIKQPDSLAQDPNFQPA